MMEWSTLKSAECCWNLSAQQKDLLVERIFEGHTASRKFYIPMLKPILAVAGMAVLLFGLLLLWPKKPMEEQIVTVPGASSEAKPGGYIEKNEPSEEGSQTPPKEEEKGTPPGEEKHPAAGGEEEEKDTKKLPFDEVMRITNRKVKKSNFDRLFNLKLTEKERKAFSQYLPFENYYYLKAQEEGEIGRLKESRADEYILEVKVFTTKEYLGEKLFENLPVGELLEKTDVKTPLESENPYYPRILGKEIESAGDYIGNLSLGHVVPEGKATAVLKLGKQPMTKEQSQILIDYFLAMDEVIWIEFSYQVKDENGNPTTIHKFWETQEEMPFEEAKAIAFEKVQKRFEQKLSEKERMAFYVMARALNHQLWNQKERCYACIDVYSTRAGIGLNPTEDFSLEQMDLDGERLVLTSSAEENKCFLAAKGIYDHIILPKEKVKGNGTDYDYKKIATFSARTTKVGYYSGECMDLQFLMPPAEKDDPRPTVKQMDECARHFYSIDCVVWFGFEGESSYIDDPGSPLFELKKKFN